MEGVILQHRFSDVTHTEVELIINQLQRHKKPLLSTKTAPCKGNMHIAQGNTLGIRR